MDVDRYGNVWRGGEDYTHDHPPYKRISIDPSAIGFEDGFEYETTVLRAADLVAALGDAIASVPEQHRERVHVCFGVDGDWDSQGTLRVQIWYDVPYSKEEWEAKIAIERAQREGEAERCRIQCEQAEHETYLRLKAKFEYMESDK